MDILQTLEKELAQAKKQVKALGKAVAAFRKAYSHKESGRSAGRTVSRRRRLSAAARKRISDAQTARWAKQKKP